MSSRPLRIGTHRKRLADDHHPYAPDICESDFGPGLAFAKGGGGGGGGNGGTVAVAATAVEMVAAGMAEPAMAAPAVEQV